MNHAKNIKDTLSLQTGSSYLLLKPGGNNTVDRNVATSGYSSVPDSQSFGSQVWMDSQGTSQDQSLSSRNSGQSSQEGNDPKLSSIYHTKPLLFGSLDKFEEEKKKSEEKNDRDILAKECLRIRETLKEIQQLVAGDERNSSQRLETALEKFKSISTSLQSSLVSLHSDVSQQLQTLLDRVNSQRDTMTQLEEKVRKSGDSSTELGSNVRSLKNDLDFLKQEREREQTMLEEALKLLNVLVSEQSAKSGPEKVTDTGMQTSPEQTFASDTLARRRVADPKHTAAKKKRSQRDLRKSKKRRPVSSRRWKRASTTNGRPLVELNRNTPPAASGPAPPSSQSRSRGATGCFITPLSCWSHDSSSAVRLLGVDAAVGSPSEAGTPEDARGFWQLFDAD